jgi:nicotinamide-nucleotide amidase
MKAIIKSKVLKTWGHSESRLAEILSDRIKQLDEKGNPTLAFLASGIEGLKVRITAKGETEAAVLSAIEKEEAIVRDLLGNSIFGSDDETMESVVIKLLKQKNLTMSVTEVTSGGIASTRLSSKDPFGEVFFGGLIPRSSKTRQHILGLKNGLVGTKEGAKSLAKATREIFWK